MRRFDRETLAGFINPYSYLQPQAIELLTPAGSLLTLSYSEVKSVCFVKDFDAEVEPRKVLSESPEAGRALGSYGFSRFRSPGRDSPERLLVWETAGFTVTPPEPDANNQRVFVPREALKSIQVLGVVGSPLAKKRKKAAGAEQPTLF